MPRPFPRHLAGCLFVTLLATGVVAGCAQGDRGTDSAHGGQGTRSATSSSAARGVRARTAHDGQQPAAAGDAGSRAEQVVRSMPLEHRAGQLVMTKLDGQRLAANERDVLVHQHLGGIILFGYNYAGTRQLRAFTADIQRAGRNGNDAGLGMLVSVDQEGGTIRRIVDAPPVRSQVQLGAAGSGYAAYRSGVHTGVALRRLGINMNLAPVADLALPPRRTMAHRSFGSDPALVGRLVAETARGLRAGRVAATPKHFPGFGGASANSDDAVARVGRSRRQLQDDLAAFRPAIDDELDAVMVSHALYPVLDARLPASLSPEVLTLLRDELGFEGVAVTDSLNAKGLRGAWGDTVPRACVQAVRAGIDLVLLTGSLETATLCRRRLVDAVRDGTLDAGRLDQAATRVVALKLRLGLGLGGGAGAEPRRGAGTGAGTRAVAGGGVVNPASSR